MPSTDDLMQFAGSYDRELRALRRYLEAFAGEWPDAALTLDIAGGMPTDPDMARLLEGFAYLCARLQVRLDDGYQSLCRQLLSVYFPDYLKPVPPAGVIRFDTSQLKDPWPLSKGTAFELAYQGQAYRFQVRNETELSPVIVEDVCMLSDSIPAPVARVVAGARSAIKVSLCSADRQSSLSKTLTGHLDLYANPDAVSANEFLDCLLSSLSKVVVEAGGRVYALDTDSLTWPIFAENCQLLPADAGLFDALQLLRDFFSYPELFRFLRLDLAPVKECLEGPEATIWLVMNEPGYGLEKDIGVNHLVPGCVPVVNLYEVKSEPLRLDHESAEVAVRLGLLYESARVYDIHSVSDITEPDKPCLIPRLFHTVYDSDDAGISWQLSVSEEHDFLQFMDCRPGKKELRVLAADCIAYDPEAGEIPVTATVRSVGGAMPCKGQLMMATTRSQASDFHHRQNWRLLSALQLNIRSIRMNSEEADSIRQILGLFVREQSGLSPLLVEAIESFICSREIRPCRDGRSYFVSQGCHFKVIVNATRLGRLPVSLVMVLLERVLNFWRPFGTHSRFAGISRYSETGRTAAFNFPARIDG